MYQPKLPKDLRCPLEFALEFFSGRWKSRILCLLYSENSVRYNDIKKALDSVSDTVLANTLKELIGHGLIERHQFPEIPPRVEYSLTEKAAVLFRSCAIFAVGPVNTTTLNVCRKTLLRTARIV